jgi:hypothetical protein
MDDKKIRRGIAAYQHEQKVFLRLLRKRGSFTENEFDQWFRGREWKRPRFRAHGITGDTFILGMGMNGGNLWAEMLELLQMMMAIGMVDTRTESGAVVYLLGANVEVTGAARLYRAASVWTAGLANIHHSRMMNR